MLVKYPLLVLLSLGSLSAKSQSLVAASPPAGDTAAVPVPGAAVVAQNPLAAHPITLAVQNGILTVDGFTARMAVHQEIRNAGYLSLFVPGTGTVVISLAPTPGSTLVPHAFHGSELRFSAGGRDFAVHSETPLPEGDAYIRLDSACDDWVGQPFLSHGDPASVTHPGPEMARDLSAPVAHLRGA